VALGLAKWISSGLQKDSLPHVSMLSGADRACVVRRSQPTDTAVVPTVELPFYPLSDHRHRLTFFLPNLRRLELSEAFSEGLLIQKLTEK
jgi:hypothetical protein